jgi:uncharacterized protein
VIVGVPAILGVAVVAAVVGFFIGTVGVGGVLLIPVLGFLAQVDIHTASATALFAFFFCGIVGAALFHRRGNVDFRTCIPVCIGGLSFSFVGAYANSAIGSHTLTRVIGLVVVASGILALRRPALPDIVSRKRQPDLALFSVGVACGFASGLSGAGGPVFLLPALLAMGYPPLIAVGVGQVFQVASAGSGSISNMLLGHVSFFWASVTLLPLLASVVIGVRFAHGAPSESLRRVAAILCGFVGILILTR